MTCEFCTGPGGVILWQERWCRVVHVDEPGYPGFCRVIWNTHVREMTDLNAMERTRLLHVVLTVEAVLRAFTRAHKMNLASLGNLTPHVHWHVIPRFMDDPHFPQPIWGQRQRDAAPRERLDLDRLRRALESAIGPVL